MLFGIKIFEYKSCYSYFNCTHLTYALSKILEFPFLSVMILLSPIWVIFLFPYFIQIKLRNMNDNFYKDKDLIWAKVSLDMVGVGLYDLRNMTVCLAATKRWLLGLQTTAWQDKLERRYW